MSIEKAKEYYLNKSGKGKLNCAQAVTAAFGQKFSASPDTMKLFATYGSGRAPEGECGAYYAAKYLLKEKHQDKIQECEDIFTARAGSTKCKEIRKLKRLPCVGCVETAATFLDRTGGTTGCSLTQTGEFPALNWKSGISLERQIRIISGSMVVAGILLGWLVHWAFVSISLFVGCGLIYAGLTDNCLMGILLMKLPYNK